MTTEQMDWLDDYNRRRRDSSQRPIDDPAGASFTCDWGDCDRETKAWRWHKKGKQWLPVCRRHAGFRRWLAGVAQEAKGQ